MNMFSHLKIGVLVYRHLTEKHRIHLSKSAFLFGNIRPDLSVNVIAKPHYVENYLKEINQEVQKLSSLDFNAPIDRGISKRLGMICHYYTDFFCYPHNHCYTGSAIDHTKYEWALNNYFKEQMPLLQEIDFTIGEMIGRTAEDTIENLALLHERFMRSKPSFGNDIYYGLFACTSVMASLLCGNETVHCVSAA